MVAQLRELRLSARLPSVQMHAAQAKLFNDLLFFILDRTPVWPYNELDKISRF